MTVNFEKSHSPNEITRAVRTDAQTSRVVCDILTACRTVAKPFTEK